MDGDESKDNQLDEFIPIEDLQPKEEFNPESTTSSIENLGKFTSPKESDPKPEPEPESQSTSPRDNFWGYFTILVAVVLIIALGATWYKFYYIGQQGPPVIEGSAYSLNPAEHLDDWTLALESRNLAEIPLEKKKGFLISNVTDAAAWEFRRGEETLTVTSVLHKTEEDALNSLKQFKTPISWKTKTTFLNGNGVIGLPFIDPGFGANKPLMSYTINGNLVVYTTYFNYKNMAYNNSLQLGDERYIIEIIKKTINAESQGFDQTASGSSEEGASPEENTGNQANQNIS